MSHPAILGIDAGFTAMGMAIVDIRSRRVLVTHCARTAPQGKKRGLRVADDDAQRCAELATAIWTMLEVHAIGAVVVELPSGGAQGARANRAMGMATGIVASVMALRPEPVEWVTPGEVKRIAGSRSASKADVEAAVLERLTWAEDALPATKAEREHVCDSAAAVLAAEGGAMWRILLSTP